VNKLKQMLKQSDLANLLQVSEWTIWAMRRRNELPPATRIGRYLRWDQDVITAWQNEREKPSEEFDPAFCERSAKAVRARKKIKGKASDRSAKKIPNRGRPTKAEQVEGRR